MIKEQISYRWFGLGFLSCSIYIIFYLNIPNRNIIINLLKAIIFVMPFCYMILLKVKKPPQEVMILFILYMFMLISFLTGVILEKGVFRDIFFANTIFCIGYLFTNCQSFSVMRDSLFLGIILSLILGGILDLNAYIGGYSIWEEMSFVGGLGNPSSYGLLCNLSIAWLLFSNFSINRISITPKFSLVILLSFLSIMSFSLFATFNLILVFMFFISQSPFRVTAKVFLIFILLVAVIFLMTEISLPDVQPIFQFLLHKLMGFADFLGFVDYETDAASVSVRLGVHERAAYIFNDQWVSMLLGHPYFISYDKNDSQILTYALSFGIPLMIIFMLLNLRFLYLAFHMREKFYFVFFTSFFLIFATNRILDYFPIALIYFLMVVAMTNSFKVKRMML